MEIEEFIEQDILVFLDDRLDKPRSGLSVRQRAPILSSFVTRDYEYEFFMALDRKDINNAKQVLHDLKEKFEECPNNAAEKLQLKSLLLDLYEKFKDQLDAQDTFTRIDQQLSGTKPATAQPTTPITPLGGATPIVKTNEETKSGQSTRAPIAVAKQEKQPPPAAVAPKPDIEESVGKRLDKITAALAKNDLKAAIHEYREAKRLVGETTANISDALVARCLIAYQDVHRQLEHRVHEHQERQTTSSPLPELPPLYSDDLPSKKNEKKDGKDILPPVPSTEKMTDAEVLLGIQRYKRELDQELQDGSLSKAMRSYRNMRLLAQQVRDPTKATEVEGKLQQIYTLIQQLRQHLPTQELGLAGALP
jgi:DNA polymerase III gamma/tau subunit